MLVRESKPFSYEVKTDKKYAVKTINKMHVKKKPFLQKYIDQEIEIMRKLDHPNIVKH
jgi:serine/threonine protein kinase